MIFIEENVGAQPEDYLVLVGPRLSGFLDYPDFFSSPNFVMNIH